MAQDTSSENHPMALILVGYRGSGKSTVGNLLAARLGRSFLDADTEIERQAGCSIAEIFESEGEPGFRAREVTVTQTLLECPSAVISTGGGAVLSGQLRRSMARAEAVIYLKITPATAHERIQRDAKSQTRRPALTNLPARQEIESIMSAREPLYQQSATLTIVADELSAAEIVDQILATLPRHLGPRERA